MKMRLYALQRLGLSIARLRLRLCSKSNDKELWPLTFCFSVAFLLLYSLLSRKIKNLCAAILFALSAPDVALQRSGAGRRGNE